MSLRRNAGSAENFTTESVKTFIAISTEIFENRLIAIRTSRGDILRDVNGLSTQAVLDFLYSLRRYRKNKSGVVFVTYGASVDNEFIFAGADSETKDKLFQVAEVTAQIENLEREQEHIDEKFFNAPKDSQEFEQADFNKYVNGLALQELKEIKIGEYKVRLANGKSLTLTKRKKSFSIYDIFGFFKPKSLREAVAKWLRIDVPALDKTLFMRSAFMRRDGLSAVAAYSEIEAAFIERLAIALNKELVDVGISLQRFHGASAVSSHWLNRIQATGEYFNYRYRRQHAPELYHAVRQCFYGGRSEQFKLGTLNDVFVYDINSAYGYACLYLPKMLRKPTLCREWRAEPFSMWQVEFDFTKANKPYYGFLPYRDLSGATKYRLKGKGYYWQPEVAFALTHYPECVKVGRGYYLPYETADFTKGIAALYMLRRELANAGNPLESVIKLALAAIFGKFCQQVGKSGYFNMYYAGFIQSFTRTQLLNAAHEKESSVICFQTDAIHTTEKLPVTVSEEIGEFKLSYYNRVQYLDNGVYKAVYDGAPVKTKSRGFRDFDFDKSLDELKTRQVYTALAEFFVGYNIFSRNILTGAEYLKHHKQEKVVTPITTAKDFDRSAMRLFDACGVDLSESFLDSKPIPYWNGAESMPYKQSSNKVNHIGLDTIEARRI